MVVYSDAIEVCQEMRKPSDITIEFLCQVYNVGIMIFLQELQHPVDKRTCWMDTFVDVEQLTLERLKLTFGTLRFCD